MIRVVLFILCAALAAPAWAAHLVVSGAWVRYLSPVVPAAGYFTVRNLGDRPAYLVGAASPTFGGVMLHRTITTSGAAKMEPVSKLEVPAGGEIKFAPGGYHLMLMNVQRKLKIGELVPITLQFAGQTVTTEFTVRGAVTP